MTRIHLRWVLLSVVGLYVISIVIGVALRSPFEHEESGYYKAYKDFIPLIIAIPAAYLAFAFQRRGSYLQALRGLWSHMVSAVSSALTYTETAAPTEEQYLQVLTKLSAAIEEVRGVFKNVMAPGTADGWYPFEPVKQIFHEIRDLGFYPAATPERREEARAQVYDMWKRSRSQLLAEFDRDKPTHHHAQYAPSGPRHGTSAPHTVR